MKYYLIGIAGNGMAALAFLLQDEGNEVCGCDPSHETFITKKLIERKISLYEMNSLEYLSSDAIIIGHTFYNNVITDILDKTHIPYYEYNEFIVRHYKKENLVGICGSHGKTTLTKMLALCDANSSYLVGDAEGKKINNDSFFFLESCEYKRHFLVYNPNEIIICNIDYDHTDYFYNELDYQTAYNEFCETAKVVFINYLDKDKINHPNVITYGLDNKANYYFDNLSINEQGFIASLYKDMQLIVHIKLPFHTINIIENILAVLAFYNEHGYDLNKILSKLSSFSMPYQRFNIIKKNKNVFILDYAHHPTQIKLNYQNVVALFPSYKKVAIFKLDRRSRLDSFKDKYIKSLELYDQAYVLPLCNVEDNRNKSSKELVTEKITYIENIKEISIEENTLYSLMSSKDLKELFKDLIGYTQ